MLSLCVWIVSQNTLILCFMGEDLLTAEQVAFLLFQNVVQCFGIPASVIYYIDLRFPSNFWKLEDLPMLRLIEELP